MRWKGFDIQREEGKLVFYVLGYSISKDVGAKDMLEYNIYRMVSGEGRTE